MKQRILIVDGHSMIFASPDLASQHANNTANARDGLIRLLTGLQDATDWTVAVVFDGKGPKASSEGSPHGIAVFYSREGQTADAIIERLAAKYGVDFQVTVATNDRMERTTSESFGCDSISATQLFMEIERANESLREKIRRLQ
jgi:predicted RNA-binding protein with PIN domain